MRAAFRLISISFPCFALLMGVAFGQTGFPPKAVPLDPDYSYLQPVVALDSPSNPSEAAIPPSQRANLSPDVNSLVAGNNKFAVNIFQRLAAQADADRNLLVSPFSISSALAMTYAGAQGRTAQQMSDVLGFTLPNDRLHSAYGALVGDLTADRPAYQLSVANRLFGQAGYSFKQPFLDVTANDYHAPLEATNFVGDPEGSRQHINDWVANQTHDKILNLLPQGSVTTDTRLVLTNAIYFNGKWKSKFDEQNTTDRPFYSADGSAAPAKTMFQQQTFRFGQFDGFKMLEMPYAGDDLSMVVMLPTARDGLNGLETSLTPDMLTASLNGMYSTDVDVYLPKFKFDASFQLGDTLKSMGIIDTFNPIQADLSGIVSPDVEQLYISSVIHKATIEVDEAGTVAAAATGVVGTAYNACFGCARRHRKCSTPIIRFCLRCVTSTREVCSSWVA